VSHFDAFLGNPCGAPGRTFGGSSAGRKSALVQVIPAMLQSGGMATALRFPARVLGIDPGLDTTGYGVVDCQNGDVRLVEAGVIRPTRKTSDGLPVRLKTLFDGIREVIQEFEPQAVCLEEVYSHASFPRTSILMGHARGVICLAAALQNVPVINLPAKRIKKALTGNGNASKAQVQRAIQQKFSLARFPHPPDVADALAAAVCFTNRWQRPEETPIEKSEISTPTQRLARGRGGRS
jgi:crossover junction endodeoxyribonuclease RuvC